MVAGKYQPLLEALHSTDVNIEAVIIGGSGRHINEVPAENLVVYAKVCKVTLASVGTALMFP